jgi:hypothetical protein
MTSKKALAEKTRLFAHTNEAERRPSVRVLVVEAEKLHFGMHG